MDRILRTSGLQTFLILFSPFLFIILVMFILTNSGNFNNDLFMFAGLFYVYPQMFILTYWAYFVSHKINAILHIDLKQDLKRLDDLFKIARFIIIGCFISALIMMLASKISTSELTLEILTYLTLPFNIGQIFVLINILIGFNTLSKLIFMASKDRRSSSSGNFILFFFLPLTIGPIQRKIRDIFNNYATPHS